MDADTVNEMIDDLQDFLARVGKPLITDAALLPHDKWDLIEALTIDEQRWEAKKKLFEAVHDPRLPQLEELLKAIKSSRFNLGGYATVEIEDETRVRYFNSFSSLNEIPSDELAECNELSLKYLRKGYSEVGIELPI